MGRQIYLLESTARETFPRGNITSHNHHGKTDFGAVLSISASSILKYPSLSLRTQVVLITTDITTLEEKAERKK